jgi:hypothetical protein
MEQEKEELIAQLQGHWQLENEGHSFEIAGTAMTVFTKTDTVTTSIEIVRNIQLKNWQIKTKLPGMWNRTFVVQITAEACVLYDFEPTVSMAINARCKLLNPSRVFRYSKMPALVEP